MKKWLALIVLSGAFGSCKNDGFRSLGEQYEMKLIEFGESTKKIQPPSYVQFHWKIMTQKDSILLDERLFLKIDSIYLTQGITQSLSILQEEEAALFKLDSKRIELEFDEIIAEEALDLDQHQGLLHYLKVEKIYFQDEFEQERTKFIEWISAQHELEEDNVEMTVIENFATRNFEKPLTQSESGSGLSYLLFPSHSGIKTGYGKNIKIHYSGGILDHPETHQTVRQDFRIGEEMQVIRAIEELLLHMEQGDSAILLAPSKIAFGEKGSSTGIIPPATPVYYEVVLDSVLEH